MKYVLVTGGYGGMGRKTCQELIKQGFVVFALDLKVEEKQETKAEEQKPQDTKKEENKVVRCTTNNNHGMNIGNSNRWFDTYNSAVAYYDNLISNYGSKLRAEEITIEEYDKKCPCGYETWSCPYCGKWTVNFYYR